MPTNADLLLDTSAALPLVLGSDDAHPAVTARTRGLVLGLAGHAMVELYSVLTRLPGAARLSPSAAARVVAVNFPASHPLSVEMTLAATRLFAEAGIAGGASYDALVGLAAHEAGMTLLTRDARAQGTYVRLGVDVELI